MDAGIKKKCKGCGRIPVDTCKDCGSKPQDKMQRYMIGQLTQAIKQLNLLSEIIIELKKEIIEIKFKTKD